MSKICPACNNRYKDDSIFCPDCGTALISSEIESKNGGLYPPVKTAVYFWLDIAMMIPFIGFILSIVFTAVPQNRSLKNFAKAHLIGYLIILGLGVLALIITIVISIIIGGSITALFGGGSPAQAYPVW